MSDQPDLSSHWCWNKECQDYGVKGKGNIVFKEWKGKNKRALLRCRTCGKCFSEAKGTIFHGLHTSTDEMLRVLSLLPEKTSIRGLARATGHDKNAISRWIQLAGKQAKEVNEFFLKDLRLTQVQIDEIWSYIKKRTKS